MQGLINMVDKQKYTINDIIGMLNECSNWFDENQFWSASNIISEMVDVFKKDFGLFECPFSENDYLYSVDDCADCHCFWDCEKGLTECLKDDYFEEYHQQIKEALEKI